MTPMRNKRGMTLIEAVVTASILSMVTVTLVALLMQSMRGWTSGTHNDTAASQVTVAMQKLCNDIRDARSASISSGRLVVTFPTTLTDTSTGETVYDLSSNSAVTRSYYISNGNLVRNVGGVVTVLGKGITSASFGASGGTVSVTLAWTARAGSSCATRQLTGRVSLRNFRS